MILPTVTILIHSDNWKVVVVEELEEWVGPSARYNWLILKPSGEDKHERSDLRAVPDVRWFLPGPRISSQLFQNRNKLVARLLLPTLFTLNRSLSLYLGT